MGKKPEQVTIDLTIATNKRTYEVDIEHAYRGFVIVGAESEEEARVEGLKKFEEMNIIDIMERSQSVGFHVESAKPVKADWKFKSLQGE